MQSVGNSRGAVPDPWRYCHSELDSEFMADAVLIGEPASTIRGEDTFCGRSGRGVGQVHFSFTMEFVGARSFWIFSLAADDQRQGSH